MRLIFYQGCCIFKYKVLKDFSGLLYLAWFLKIECIMHELRKCLEEFLGSFHSRRHVMKQAIILAESLQAILNSNEYLT